jgi:hypothetical protein
MLLCAYYLSCPKYRTASKIEVRTLISGVLTKRFDSHPGPCRLGTQFGRKTGSRAAIPQSWTHDFGSFHSTAEASPEALIWFRFGRVISPILIHSGAGPLSRHLNLSALATILLTKMCGFCSRKFRPMLQFLSRLLGGSSLYPSKPSATCGMRTQVGCSPRVQVTLDTTNSALFQEIGGQH